jgi:hypothetical protein
MESVKIRSLAQRSGVVRVSAGNVNGARGYTAADGKGLEDDSNARQRDSYATYVWIMFK